MRKYRLNGSYHAGIGTALGVIFLCFGGFLMYQCHKFAPKQPEVMYAIGGTALLLAIVLSLLDLQNDKAAEQAKKHRARMLSMPAVTGHITAVRKRWYDRKGRELPAETAQHVHSDGIRPRWTATVTFTPMVEETRMLSTAPTQSRSSVFMMSASCAMPFQTPRSLVSRQYM